MNTPDDGQPPQGLARDFVDLYASARMLETALWFDASLDLTAIADALSLTEAGAKWIEAVPDTVASSTEATVAAFLVMSDYGPLIDYAASDSKRVTEAISTLVETRRITLSWLFGTELQRRYQAQFDEYKDYLDLDESAKLLDGLEQGVFQLGTLVSGPYGLIRSTEDRLFPPANGGPTVACSDPGCQQLHGVDLGEAKHPVRDAVALMHDLTGGPDSDLRREFEAACGRDERYMDDQNPTTLPLLLANALSHEELRKVFRLLVSKNGGARKNWPTGPTQPKGEIGKLAGNLSHGQLLQLCLVHTNAEIGRALDGLVELGDIDIPPNETRTPVVGAQSLDAGYFDVQAELSAQGLRYRPRRTNVSTLRLLRLIRRVYSSEADLSQLEWALRSYDGVTGMDRLRIASIEAAPIKLLNELLFSSQDRLSTAASMLGIEDWAVDGGDQERFLVERIMWKLGFAVESHAGPLSRFWDRLDRFEAVVARIPGPYRDADKDQLRSAGVNLFVATEEVLDHALAFTTWALLNDHYRAGRMRRFRFNLADARDVMVEFLSGVRVADNVELEISADGRNTLFPLIHGFDALAQVCQGIVQTGRSAAAHTESELPLWIAENGLFAFPFRHRYALLDLRPDALDGILTVLRDVVPALDRGGVAGVRNALEHNRAGFPAQAELLKACLALRELVPRLEATGICPSLYVFAGESVDADHRAAVRLADYRGDEVRLAAIGETSMTGLPGVRAPQLIFHHAKLGESGDCLRFQAESQSHYAEIWRGFTVNRLSQPEEGGGANESA